MENKFQAHKKTYRKQKVKTYFVRTLIVPQWIIGGITLLLSFIFWKSLGNFIKSSNDKLSTQRELYKPIKKEYKLDKKDLKGGEVKWEQEKTYTKQD